LDSLGYGSEAGPYFTDELKLDASAPAELWICPGCGRRYVYSPVTPSGERVRPHFGEVRHFVLWCPEPCHWGERFFLWSDWGGASEADSKVSWYYQKSAKGLSTEERRQEDAYRAARGMPPLPADLK
jgi:hypothetical protein